METNNLQENITSSLQDQINTPMYIAKAWTHYNTIIEGPQMSAILYRAVRVPWERQTQSVVFQNYSRQSPRSRAQCSIVGIYSQKFLVATQCSPIESRKVSELRTNVHRHMNARHRVPNTRIQATIVTRLTMSMNHRPQHPAYACSSGTPIRSYNPVFWIHFNIL